MTLGVHQFEKMLCDGRGKGVDWSNGPVHQTMQRRGGDGEVSQLSLLLMEAT